jgi:hypothetical protein
MTKAGDRLSFLQRPIFGMRNVSERSRFMPTFWSLIALIVQFTLKNCLRSADAEGEIRHKAGTRMGTPIASWGRKVAGLLTEPAGLPKPPGRPLGAPVPCEIFHRWRGGAQ